MSTPCTSNCLSLRCKKCDHCLDCCKCDKFDFDQPIGKGTSTLDYLLVAHPWLIDWIAEQLRKAYKTGWNDGRKLDNLDDMHSIKEICAIQYVNDTTKKIKG